MGKYFPKLSQTHVFVQTDEAGNGFNCPMMPVSALVEFNSISETLNAAKSVQDVAGARMRLVTLLRTVIPAEYSENLERIDLPALSELAAYLMYGDPENDDKPRTEPNSKNG